jgi:hypothetical protein
MELLGLLGSIAFGLASAVVGVRLLLLAQRTRRAPEFAMGIAFVSSGAFGFVFYVSAEMARRAGGDEATIGRLGQIGTLFFYGGYVSMAIGTWRMFRPAARWPVALIAGFCAVLLGATVTLVRAADLRSGTPGEIAMWIGIGVGCAVFAWSAAEAWQLAGQMRRRLVLGLVEPEVVDRVRLWGWAAGAACAMTGHAIAMRLATGTAQLSNEHQLLSSCLGMIAAVAVWLAFFPPAAYRRRFARAA